LALWFSPMAPRESAEAKAAVPVGSLQRDLPAAQKPCGVLPTANSARPGPRQEPRAKAWGPPTRSTRGLAGDAHITQLKEMGFAEEQARQALTECVWDVNKALDLLVTRAASAEISVSAGAALDREVSAKDEPKLGDEPSEAIRPDSENSTSASAASSPRSSWQSFSGSPQQVAAPEREESSPTSCKPSQEELKPIRRVCRFWGAAGEAQLRVDRGDFVRVWPSSETEQGWIYAEDPSDKPLAGWLPAVVLEAAAAEQCWMMAQKTAPAIHASQLSVEEGEILKVSPGTRTAEGWTYAERGRAEDVSSVEAGWVPVCSLRWETVEA